MKKESKPCVRRATRAGRVEAPSRFEWDFSDCLQDELYECYCYEFARESEKFRNDVKRFRGHRKSAKTFNEVFNFYKSCRATGDEDQLPQNLHRACIFNFSPEFPDKPFLSIKATDRAERISRVNEVLRGGAFGGEPSIADLIKFQQIGWINIFHWGREELEERRKNSRRKIVAFDMDWTLSEPALIELFRNWIQRQRKRDGSAPTEERGLGGTKQQWKKRLKALGARRLLNCMTWQDAATLTANTNPKGKALYDDQSNWIRARKMADEILAAKESF